MNSTQMLNDTVERKIRLKVKDLNGVVYLKIAAVNFNAVFANIGENLKQVTNYVKQASDLGVELILFPEFFTSSMGRAEVMLDVAVNSDHVEEILLQLAIQHHIIIGGSYILFDGRDSYNLFQLVFPDGSIFSHKKDIPTIVENCYYTYGDENNILKTPIGDIGVALCWEMNRYDTLKRMSEKVDFVLAGSCWEDLREGAPLREYNKQFALQTPVTFAKLLHTPVIHSNHCGKVTAVDFYDEKNPFTFQMIGAAQIIDENGNVIARLPYDESEGMIISEISLEKGKRRPADINHNKYWIEEMQYPYIYAWENYSSICREYYKNVVKPYYNEKCRV
jgi:predicted amidohydrolase